MDDNIVGKEVVHEDSNEETYEDVNEEEFDDDNDEDFDTESEEGEEFDIDSDTSSEYTVGEVYVDSDASSSHNDSFFSGQAITCSNGCKDIRVFAYLISTSSSLAANVERKDNSVEQCANAITDADEAPCTNLEEDECLAQNRNKDSIVSSTNSFDDFIRMSVTPVRPVSIHMRKTWNINLDQISFQILKWMGSILVVHTPKQFPRLVTEHYLSFSLIILCFNLDTKKEEMVGKAQECQAKIFSTYQVSNMLCSTIKLRINLFIHLVQTLISVT